MSRCQKLKNLDNQRSLRTRRALATSALLIFLMLLGGCLLGGCDMWNRSGDAAIERNRADGNQNNSSQLEETTQMTEQMRLGQSVFSACAVCHQFEGQGIAGIFPPLDGSPLVNGRADNLARIVLHGLHGLVEVNGRMFDAQMPAWPQFDNRSLAAVLTYVRGSWSNNSPPVSEEFVAAVREATRGRKAAWTRAELESSSPIELKPPEESHADPSQAAQTLREPRE